MMPEQCSAKILGCVRIREKSNLVLRDVKPSTNPNDRDEPSGELRPRQRAVLAMLSDGQSIADVASAAQVGKRTIFRWLRQDAHFLAAYNRWRREIDLSVRSKVMATADAAADAVHAAVLAGDAKLAMALLKQLGLLQPPVHGAIDPANAAIEIQNQIDRERIDVRQVRADNDTQATTCGISVSWETPKVPKRAEIEMDDIGKLLAPPGPLEAEDA